MGQKERARALVEEKLEFAGATRLSPDRALAAARAAALLFDSKLSSSLREEAYVEDEGVHLLKMAALGPGRIVTLMIFFIQVTPRADGGSDIILEVDDFIFQKGSFGMSPQVNAASLVTKYVRALRQALAGN